MNRVPSDTPPSNCPEEAIKEQSRHLRGTIAESLDDRVTGSMPDADAMLLKFHGTYQQDDRDLRNERLRQKLEPAYSFMIRVRMPGGVCTPEQWLVLDEVAREFASPSLRVTTRQTFQYHGVLKRNMRSAMRGINRALLDSISACGDVNRNVVCHNNPFLSALHADLYTWARRLSDGLLPATRAYHEIWLDDAQLVSSGDGPDEPFYGSTYLPRKFKIGLALAPFNDIDVFAQDLGFIAVAKDARLTGFNVSVGGGMGTTHNDPATYPRVGTVIGFVHGDSLLDVAKAVIGIQRDHGDRTHRRHARFKYTLDDHGIEWFRRELEHRLGWNLEPARPFQFDATGDRLGWHQGDDGRWHLTLGVPSGRLRDTDEVAWLSGLREVAKIHDGDFRLTANQNVIVARIDERKRAAVENLLESHGIPDASQWTGLRQHALSCVSFPTCGLAMAESERWLPTLLDRLDPVLKEVKLEREAITLRVTGCPNGCARPFLAEIGLVGKAPGRYNLLLGGGFDGSRLNRPVRDGIAEEEIVATLSDLIVRYANGRQAGEHFGDFIVRTGALDDSRGGSSTHPRPGEATS